MTREQAIKILNKYDLNFCDIDGNPIPPQDLAEAVYMAIKALQHLSLPRIIIGQGEKEPKCEDCKWNTWDNNCMVEYRGCRFEPKNGE